MSDYDHLPNEVAHRLEEIDRELVGLDQRERELLEEREELVEPYLGSQDAF